MESTRRRSSAIARVLILLAAALAASACGGSSPQILSNVGAAIGEDVPGNASPATAAPAGDASNPGPAASGGAVSDFGNPRIVYTGSLDLVVTDLAPALARARTLVGATGGFVGASKETDDGDQPVATITFRIPAHRWEDTLTGLRGLATKVVSEQTAATDASGALVDLQARIANLRASEAALQDIAKHAGSVGDLLAVEQQLTDVRGQIEQLDGQRARLVDQTAYGTLVTTFGLEAAKVVETAKSWDPADDVDGATATLTGIGQHVVSGLIWFGIVWLPMIVGVTLASIALIVLVRRFGPRGSGPVGGWGGG